MSGWGSKIFPSKQLPVPTGQTPAKTPKAFNLPDGVPSRTDVTDSDRLNSYVFDYQHAVILPTWLSRAQREADLARTNLPRYSALAANVCRAMGKGESFMPWQVPALLSMMEASIGDWSAYLGNGEHIIGTGRKSSLVPSGRGPFKTWEDGAMDALTSERMAQIPVWDIPHILYFAEGFNGLGYFHMKKYSPYLWSGTNFGVGSGKYVADGVYSATAVSDQLGVAAAMIALGMVA